MQQAKRSAKLLGKFSREMDRLQRFGRKISWHQNALEGHRPVRWPRAGRSPPFVLLEFFNFIVGPFNHTIGEERRRHYTLFGNFSPFLDKNREISGNFGEAFVWEKANIPLT